MTSTYSVEGPVNQTFDLDEKLFLLLLHFPIIFSIIFLKTEALVPFKVGIYYWSKY